MSNIITPFPQGEDPLASKLRNAVKQACDPARPVIISADSQGNIQTQSQQEVQLKPFDNGPLFAYSPNPKRPGTFFLHDAAGFNVALVVSEQIANILCRGAHLFYEVAKKQIEDAKAVASAAKTAETLATEIATPAASASVPGAPYCEELPKEGK